MFPNSIAFSFTLHKRLAKIVAGCIIANSFVDLCIKINIIGYLIVFRFAIYAILF